MIRASFAVPTSLVLLAMVGMMIVFMHDSRDGGVPFIVILLGIFSAATVINALYIEWRRPGPGRRMPGWALPVSGTLGGLAVCAQLAIYLANDLQDEPVQWFLHAPGLAMLVALAALLHVAWRD